MVPPAHNFGAVWCVPRPPTSVAYGDRVKLYLDWSLGLCEDTAGVCGGVCVCGTPWLQGMIGTGMQDHAWSILPSAFLEGRDPSSQPTRVGGSMSSLHRTRMSLEVAINPFYWAGGLTRADFALSSPRRCRCWQPRGGPAAAGRPAHSPPLSLGPAGKKMSDPPLPATPAPALGAAGCQLQPGRVGAAGDAPVATGCSFAQINHP